MSVQNQLILGVMGVDVALSEIQALTPRYKVAKTNSNALQMHIDRNNTKKALAGDKEACFHYG